MMEYCITCIAFKVCRSETDMLAYLESATNGNVFLVVHCVTDTLITVLEPFKQIDSIFLFTTEIHAEAPPNITACCSTELSLVNELKKARKEFINQIAAASVLDRREKAMRDLSQEKGSFLLFQVFKAVLLRMTNTEDAKRMMVSMCRDYYRGNATELANITAFEQTYRAVDVIGWYTKETFVYKLVSRAIRTEDVYLLYLFRFFCTDFSLQLKLHFEMFKKRSTENVLRFYRASKMTREEISALERSVCNLISPNGYLSTSCYRQVAYGFATKSGKRAGVERVLFEYSVDLTLNKHIVFADIREYSAFPEEGEVVFDLGAVFQVDSCTYDSEDDLWLVNVSATDKGADAATAYINYQKTKVGESNMALVLGHLLVEMGEYTKARKYFDTILRSAKPTDDEIACIYHNIGRAHQLKGEYGRALACLYHAYEMHLSVRPPRLTSAAKAINTIGIVYMEQGHLDRAINAFERSLSLYKKSAEECHEYIAETLINLGNIQCQQDRFHEALSSFTQAKKVYKRHLPSDHPKIAFALNNIGILHYRQQKYDLAFQAFTKVLQIREKTLSSDHPDLARAAHNLAVIYAIRGDHDQAELFFKRAAACALSETHPFVQMVKNNTINWEIARNKRIPMMDLTLIENAEYPELRL